MSDPSGEILRERYRILQSEEGDTSGISAINLDRQVLLEELRVCPTVREMKI